MSSVYSIAVTKIGREDWWEFVAVSGYLRFEPRVYNVPERGVGPVTAVGHLLRVVHHADTGWSELLIGPEQSPITVWVEPGAIVEVTKR